MELNKISSALKITVLLFFDRVKVFIMKMNNEIELLKCLLITSDTISF